MGCKTLYRIVIWALIVEFSFWLPFLFEPAKTELPVVFLSTNFTIGQVVLVFNTHEQSGSGGHNFCKFFLLRYILSLWLADRVRPQFSVPLICGSCSYLKDLPLTRVEKLAFWTIAFNCRLDWLLEICSLFRWPGFNKVLNVMSDGVRLFLSLILSEVQNVAYWQ